MIKALVGLIITVVLSYFAITGIPKEGFFPMHDDTQVTRVFEMRRALEDGMFPVRWSQNLGYGYGYPIFNFYAPLSYYVGGYLYQNDSDALTATKTMIVIGIMLSGIFMYFLGKSLWGEEGGVVAALFYMYAPYHAVNVFVRGAVAETYAYAFVPLAFYGLWKVYTDRKWRYVIVGAVGFAGVILSHNLTAMMILPFYALTLVVLTILSLRTFRSLTLLFLPLTAGIALLLAAFYWLPVIQEMQYTNVVSQIGGGADFRDHFACPLQLWESQWGFGGSVKGCIDGLSLKIGKLHIIMSIIAVIFAFLFLRFDSQKRNAVIAIFIGLILSIVLMLPISRAIWESISQMTYLQFPWRFLLIASFFTSLLAGSVPYALRNFTFKGATMWYFPMTIAIILVAILMFFNLKLFTPQTVNAKTDKDYTELPTIRYDISKISDEYMPKGFEKPATKDDLIESKITAIDSIPTIEIDYEDTDELEAFIETARPVEVLVNIAYFPAWHVFLDDEEVKYKATNNGLVVPIPPGAHSLYATFIETDIEKNANTVSLAGIGVLLLGIIVAAWRHTL